MGPFGTVNTQMVVEAWGYEKSRGCPLPRNGFYYMRARYYDPSVGRFISEDPIGFDGGDVNLMAYVQNNPVSFADPSGLSYLLFDRSRGTLYLIPETNSIYTVYWGQIFILDFVLIASPPF
jgi:RHS repeat-associated protein